MFTGIITAVGQIASVQALGSSPAHGRQLHIQTPAGYLDDVALGDSIALNGACMTVTALAPTRTSFSVDISAESLARTCGLDAPGPVNLEKALRAHERLGGHIVTGHVDGIGRVTHFAPVGESWALRILAPVALGKYLARKGSVTVNGVSLTVNAVVDLQAASTCTATTNSEAGGEAGCEIAINLIPHTVQNTALHSLQPNAQVNLEIDLIARYVERMLSAPVSAAPLDTAS